MRDLAVEARSRPNSFHIVANMSGSTSLETLEKISRD
eukprot:CAMPEP_0115370314 /NCGR_PEP_ID=MMETSP0270-20121206/106768_1 /TAXON_ID=71861 /ORGANISM="Scrippsiella trochoidea, Strain CCMP3099" /LENGTH=36 /DNA_ID= /DNA_START= /DNA_END= /DNA_ORIENTATION=